MADESPYVSKALALAMWTLLALFRCYLPSRILCRLLDILLRIWGIFMSLAGSSLA